MKNQNKLWTENEYLFLQENYSISGMTYCVNHLERTKRSIKEQVSKLGLKLNKKLRGQNNLIHTFDKVQNAVKEAKCLSDVIRNLGLIPQAGNFDNIKNRINDYNIDTSHFLKTSELIRLRHKEGMFDYNKKPINELFILSTRKLDHRKLKERLINENIKEYKCEGNNCTVKKLWNGMPIVLRLDHINGNNLDYRIENLRFLCPNCDSQSDTFCSRNRKSKKNNTGSKIIFKDKTKIKCKDCTNIFVQNMPKHVFCSKKCRSKSSRINVNELKIKKESTYKRKVLIRPSLEILKIEIKTNGYCSTGRKYGVSDNAIRKWIKSYENKIK